ncbi:MAG: alpha-2-macroglobulin, partial [Hyphomicrobiaceae bacterium]|nr:alpha-2-macroglobulin [Hyphomicrobiaceae bacterium]
MLDVSRRLVAAVFAVFLVPVAAHLAVVPAHAADKRVIITDNADYSGFDLRTEKNVTLGACQNACLADGMCKAFTFNTKANWCFLKSDFAALVYTTGATAGRVVDVPELTPSIEQQRVAELNFLPKDYIDEARSYVGAVKERYPSQGTSYSALRAAGAAAMRAANYDEAALVYGRALALASEDGLAWLDYARASLARSPSSYSDRDRANTDATAGALNGYLRVEATPARAVALALAGAGLAKREAWKSAIRTYRASLKLAEVASVRAEYEKVVAEHGFRITSHEVEADAAEPQICLRFSDALPVARPDLADFRTVEDGAGLAIEPQASQICVNGVKHGQRYIIRVRAGLPAADGETLEHPVEISVYIRDRAPWVGFAGNA